MSWRAAALAATVATAFVSGSSYAHPGSRGEGSARAAAETTGKSTLEQTLVGGNPDEGFARLRVGPGEPHVVREEIAPAQDGRSGRRRSLIYLAQLTDFQLSDEESPSRVEFLDDVISPAASSAWRPQEAFVTHQVEYTIRQVNRFLDSPVAQGDGTRARMLNAVLTGDLADNQQRNETEWVVRLLEGGTLTPNSGSSDVQNDYDAFCQSQVASGELDPAEAPRYTGFQDYDDYFESPVFYDPERPRGIYAQRGWPTWPGLMDQAQKPFAVEGLRVPSYVVFGNHDALAQGNEDALAAYEAVGIGCVKPLAPVPNATRPLENLDPEFLQSVANDPAKAMLVPPDPNRQYVDRAQFKDLHRTGKQPDDHGFGLVDGAELLASNGSATYYSFSPTSGIRYIVIDTVSYGGNTADLADGNLDDPQWRWLERELETASQRNELILVFGHHATGSMAAGTPDEGAAPCTTNDAHGHDVNPGCDRDPRSSTPLHFGDDLTALFHRFPRVIAYVAGHSHENRIAPNPDGRGGGFWEIKSPAIVDWPPQHRLIEVMDNRDGTLSILGTLLDHDGAAAPPASGANASGFDAETLASVGRALAYNDPQVGPGRGEEVGPEGVRTDRNVELLLRDPRAAAQPTPAREPEQPAGRREGEAEPEATEAGEGVAAEAESDLPFTGYPVLAPLVAGLLLALAGLLVRLRLRS